MRYQVLKLLRRFGYDVQRYGPYRDAMRRFQKAIERQDTTTILDVGANVGQYAQRLRINGYTGRIVSFEPLSSAYAKLIAVARSDKLWTVAPRCALSDKPGVAEINIAANSQSSSLLEMLERHTAGDPKSGYFGKETVETIPLDLFLDNHPDLATSAMAMKIDTQGNESRVLAGLNRWSGHVKVIQVEMSLTALYEGEARFIDLYRLIEDRGYQCISIEPGFIDPRTYEVLQTDAIFERKVESPG
jgi:FkbM family methyltransferase